MFTALFNELNVSKLEMTKCGVALHGNQATSFFHSQILTEKPENGS